MDISVTADMKTLLDIILTDELEQDQSDDRPERSKSEILEMIPSKGYRAWKQEDSLVEKMRVTVTVTVMLVSPAKHPENKGVGRSRFFSGRVTRVCYILISAQRLASVSECAQVKQPQGA